MKPGDRRYTIHWHQSGQVRPYGPTIHDFTIQAEWIPYKNRNPEEDMAWEPNDLLESLFDSAAKGIGVNFYTKQEKPDWHLPKLKSKSKVGIGQWRYQIESEYTG